MQKCISLFQHLLRECTLYVQMYIMLGPKDYIVSPIIHFFICDLQHETNSEKIKMGEVGNIYDTFWECFQTIIDCMPHFLHLVYSEDCGEKLIGLCAVFSSSGLQCGVWWQVKWIVCRICFSWVYSVDCGEKLIGLCAAFSSSGLQCGVWWEVKRIVCRIFFIWFTVWSMVRSEVDCVPHFLHLVYSVEYGEKWSGLCAAFSSSGL
jgi:hypothetical protein